MRPDFLSLLLLRRHLFLGCPLLPLIWLSWITMRDVCLKSSSRIYQWILLAFPLHNTLGSFVIFPIVGTLSMALVESCSVLIPPERAQLILYSSLGEIWWKYDIQQEDCALTPPKISTYIYDTHCYFHWADVTRPIFEVRSTYSRDRLFFRICRQMQSLESLVWTVAVCISTG